MDIKFPKAGVVRPIELRIRRLRILTSLKFTKLIYHFPCKIYMVICMRDNTMHLFRDSWQFSFRITEKESPTSSEKPQFT